jgi:DNA-directed RNA polymerase specialized sigma24 family protein
MTSMSASQVPDPGRPLPAPPLAADARQASELYFSRIHRAALILTGNPWDADDLAQETFLVMSTQAA